jgi:hypothetical protein
MAVGTGYSKTTTNGLIFAYDVGDTTNSFLGRPTDNLSANYGMSTYNNVGGNVSSLLTSTGTYYRGAEIIKQDLTALDGSGAYYLSNVNNPGIGVVTSGGGGTANTYTGHSIFFKPTVTMNGTPIYTNYSNIGGWQSSGNYESMGDGWFRAYVLWYNTITQSDGKYWAINPLSTAVGQTVTIYWAGPFKESLNSTSVSQFINGTRSSTQGLIDISGGGSSLDLSSVSYTNPPINPQITFDGSNDRFDTGITNVVNDASYEVVLNCKGNVSTYNMYMGQYLPYLCVYGGNRIYYSDYINGSQTAISTDSGTIAYNTYYHVVCTREYNGSSTIQKIYINGTLYTSGTFSGAKSAFYSPNTINIGDGAAFTWYPFYGDVPVAKVYNRTLSLTEIQNNYNHYKTRFNLS